jgi:hypothetical protein
MGEAVAINDLPAKHGRYLSRLCRGLVISGGVQQLSVTLNISPVAYSLQALQWDEISAAFDWSGVSPTLDWARATIVV